MKNLLLLIIMCLGLTANAQLSMLSEYSLASDTVTNTGTGYLSVRNPGAKSGTTVQIVATKISGTVAGTISLLGSVDGINYKAFTLAEASTAGHTFTATDVASQNFIWRLNDNPYLYYRVSWTGSGTMAARFTAKLLSR